MDFGLKGLVWGLVLLVGIPCLIAGCLVGGCQQKYQVKIEKVS